MPDLIESGKIDRIPLFSGAGPEKMVGVHYFVANCICAIIILVFLGLIIWDREIPEYLIGFVGSIIGYYIAKAPYDL
ncbi:MAG TPA: hypothetical protein VKE88_01620 [Candidatus Nanoarchaeia archaeon]|nr:hypothetical protein [Candidatus Nanoarchaeia archaeon]